MIEQIINWWNSSETIIVLVLITSPIWAFLLYIITEQFKNKRKTTTQKYREGLIKK